MVWRWSFCGGLVRALSVLLIFYSHLASANVIFKKVKITLAGKDYQVELAETPEQHQRGLMFRKSLGENDGMLFVFSSEQTRNFWMKNTLIDLDIGYFDASGKLIDIQGMKSGKGIQDGLLPNYASAKPAQYALEMNRGWFKKNQVKLGAKLLVHR